MKVWIGRQYDDTYGESYDREVIKIFSTEEKAISWIEGYTDSRQHIWREYEEFEVE